MKLRILTPTCAPTLADLPAIPRKGDHILLAGDVLEVQRVVWPVTRYLEASVGVVDEVEVYCDLAEDVGDTGVTYHEADSITYHDADGNEVDPPLEVGKTYWAKFHPPITTPIGR